MSEHERSTSALGPDASAPPEEPPSIASVSERIDETAARESTAARTAEDPGGDTRRRRSAGTIVLSALKVLLTVVAWLLLAVGALLIGSAGWIRRTFGAVTVDQMLMNLQGTEGVGGTEAESGYIESFVWQAVVLPLAVVALLGAIVLVGMGVRRYRALHRPQRPERPEAAGAAVAERRVRRVALGALTLLSVAVLGLGALNVSDALSLPQYVRAMNSTLTMSEYYVDSYEQVDDVHEAAAPAADERPLNLITIYLESGEETLTDPSLFGESLFESLEDSTRDWHEIDGFQQYAGGGWTMAGIVGMECGVPLRGPGVGENDINSNEIGSDADVFLPGAVCLGDVLADHGYRSVFLGGADTRFASKENYLADHGYDEIKDLRTWQELGETEFSQWGLSDRALFSQAAQEVDELRAAGQPFHLSVLTLDTHEPAHLFDYCEARLSDPLADAFRCSMAEAAGFVDHLAESGALEDTAVVIVGDHRKMLAEGGHFWNELSDVEDRLIFNRIWSPREIESPRAGVDQLSIFATSLDLVGLGRQDHRAGISVSALAQLAPAGSVRTLSGAAYQELVESRSADLYRELWDARGRGTGVETNAAQ